ncbi:MAG: hypothetical protein JNL72_02730 [Flavipsychrobacter sp.]|nr:hypothetical protein [Flavipsychrobacter sp.]
MKRIVPMLGIFMLALFVVSTITSCAPPKLRPGYGSYKGYHHRKFYKPLKPSYASPKKVKVKKYK